MSLYEKMYQIMCESEALEKSMTVGFGNNSYKAISEASVLNGVKPLLKKHKLILFPVKASIVEHVDTFPNSKGETSSRLMSQVSAQYKIVDVETGESETLETVGNGSDPQDKGSGKAWTYAYKALLQKTFMLFSGEDTDNEHSDDIGSSYKPPQQENNAGRSSNTSNTQKLVLNDYTINQAGGDTKASIEQVKAVYHAANDRKKDHPEFDMLVFLDTQMKSGKITTKYPYADKEKTRVNWTLHDIETIMDLLELPF